MKKAFITGISGQDGSYLAELLLSQGYQVHGFVRRTADEHPEHRFGNLSQVLDKIQLHYGSLESFPSIFAALEKTRPDECYHLGGYSQVGSSLEEEFAVTQINILGIQNILSALLLLCPKTRLFFAGSSEMFGNAREPPQTEHTPFNPRSPYGISKVTGYFMTKYYRERHGLHASCGILYNHESPRRGAAFVTRKITAHAAQIKLGIKDKIGLGNIEARRDWGHSREYVRAMWLMLQQDKPDDYVIATGTTHSVRDCLEIAFDYCGLDPYKYLETDTGLGKFQDAVLMVGDATKAKQILGWESTIDFKSLIQEMVAHDLKYYAARVNS
ncbi:MAG: GDP-mannose 4,6-dehydratase [Deltaproteobacteria bacterium]|nr:GDP-mannose 4,6-dehydratase [Deltaproteobacteria bacterium]